jgi:hypothetical protein
MALLVFGRTVVYIWIGVATAILGMLGALVSLVMKITRPRPLPGRNAAPWAALIIGLVAILAIGLTLAIHRP